MPVTQQCQHPQCYYNALWFPVLLIHRDVDGQVANPPASWKMTTALCDEHKRQVRDVHDLLSEQQINAANLRFQRAGRTRPDWRSVEVTWDRVP